MNGDRGDHRCWEQCSTHIISFETDGNLTCRCNRKCDDENLKTQGNKILGSFKDSN